MTEQFRKATRAVVTVGDGRGFVVEGARRDGPIGPYPATWVRTRYVITAGHCLPGDLPPCCAYADFGEHTYSKLLGPLGSGPSVWAECLFVDPISDIAVLGAPDSQELYEHVEAYDALVDAAEPLAISDPPAECRAYMLSLKNEWFECTIKRTGNPLWIEGAADPIEGGMSGSPIIAADGTAIGVMCNSSGSGLKPHHEGGPNPRLCGSLPAWAVQAIKDDWRLRRRNAKVPLAKC